MSRTQWEASCATSLELSALLLSDAEVCGWNLGDKRADTTSVPYREPPVSLRKRSKSTGNDLEVLLTIKLCYDQQLELGIP